jgi:hypothetical protein
MFFCSYNKLIKQLRKMDMRTIHPIAFHNYLVRTEKGEIMALVYSVTAAAPVDADVVERRLTVTVNGEEKSSQVYASETTAFGELSFAQSDNVVLTLVDVDDAGNVSTPAVLEFVAADTIPPVAPGGLGVALVREE